MYVQDTLQLEPSRFQPLRLRMYPGGHPIDVNGPDMLLGRHSEADLRMPLPDVSRRHCRFVYSTAGWELIDLGSLNGVYVNGSRVERAILHPGDFVRICSLEFEVELADRPPAVETLSQAIRGLGDSGLAPERKSA